jgi:hypothetical protein
MFGIKADDRFSDSMNFWLEYRLTSILLDLYNNWYWGDGELLDVSDNLGYKLLGGYFSSFDYHRSLMHDIASTLPGQHVFIFYVKDSDIVLTYEV